MCQTQLLGLLDVLVDVIFCLKDPGGTYLAVNHAFVRRTGRRSKREVIGRKANDLFSPALAQRYDEQDTHVLTSGEALRDELELIRRADGTLGWYLTTKLPIEPAENQSRPGLVSVSRDLKTPRHDDGDARALAKVVEHVRSHLQDKIRVADLAETAGLTAAQLDRRMRKTFGLSPSNYVVRARVDRAAELLADAEISLANVAATAGFYDQANLTHQFARLTNETPAQFRAIQIGRRTDRTS
ncbi:MAG: AraC family transcriptional regulator [Actinomycetia bacterium]|nr:AraC family transcriptional regulator [Actinomycetes bacterium]MCP4958174.1 AraC family transcriptional regulator [Actinomycetes bacterium]